MAESATKEDTTNDKPKDSMHSGPQAAPDLGPAGLTSNPVTREMVEKGLAHPAPPPAGYKGEQSTVTVGEFKPEPGSTLVTDIPAADEPDPDAPPLNPGNPAPTAPVAKQPGETDDEAGERIAADQKRIDADKSKSKNKSASSTATTK